MKNTIEIGHLTLHKKNVRPNCAVVWDSSNLVLDTNIDMAKLFSELVFLEHETSSLKTNLQKAASEISLAISRNQYNSEFVSSFALQMSESVLRITDINKIAIFEVKKLNTFDQTITICEEEAGLEFSKLHDYILSLKRFQLMASVLEEHNVESQLSLDLLEKDLQKNQNMLDRLSAEIRDIEFMLDILNTRILTISIRLTPALNVLLELRVLASNLQLKFINFIARLKYVELHISICLLMTNTLDERRAYLTGIVLHQKNMVNKLEALFENMTNRHYELMCKIAILYQKVLELTNIANEINDYITKMKLLIEGGLLKAGKNIAIEYTAEGFAKIHSTLAPYPKREPRTRKVIKAKPMVFRIPPNPCPPLLPPCPDISATQKPTSSPTTAPTSSPTTAPTSSPTTTTTTKPDCKGCGIFGFGLPRASGPMVYVEDFLYSSGMLTEGSHSNMVSLIGNIKDINWFGTPVHAQVLVVAPCTKMTTSKGTFTGPAVVQTNEVNDEPFRDGKTFSQYLAANPLTWYGSPMTNKFLSRADMINISQNVIKVECLANCDPCANNAVV